MLKISHLFVATTLAVSINVQAQSITKADTELFEALSFVSSRLTKINRPKFVWHTADIELHRRDMWRWTEISEDAGIVFTNGAIEIYQVNPADLVIPVEAKGKDIKIECRVDKCINVNKTQYVGLISKSPEKLARTSENRVDNYWYFNSEDDARRVASALTLALSRLGAKQRY